MTQQKLFKISLIIFFVGLVIFIYPSLTLPRFHNLIAKASGSDQVLLDDKGNVIQQLRTGFAHRRMPWLPLQAFSPHLIAAVVYIEDRRFQNHWGVDLRGMARALWANFNGQSVQGASTITMQVTDLIQDSVLLSNKPITKGSYIHKVKQVLRGFWLDLFWSKKEILEVYLNLIHLRGEQQGVPAFTYSYFGKGPSLLSKTEAITIASIIYKPNISGERLSVRACQKAKGLWQDFDCKKIKVTADSLSAAKAKNETRFALAPHLGRRIFSTNKKQTHFRSFIDRDLQGFASEVLQKNLSYLQKNNVSDMAAIVIENETGKVLAYVGSVAKYSKAQEVDGADSPRQAGSTLKPFLFGRAIDKKLITASSIIKDEPTALSWAGGVYRPRNYDNKFHGAVTARQALASSLNVPAIKAVLMLGLQESYQVIESLQFSALRGQDYYGASLALGAVEVKLHELANAYRSLHQGGVLSPLKWWQGEPEPSEPPRQILSPEVSYIIMDILSDPDARRIGFAWNSALETSFWTAVKTGTSKALRDNWCVGVSGTYTVGVWAGNFSSQSMRGVSGVTGAAPSWYEIMQYLHRNKKSERPHPPQTLLAQRTKYSWRTGSALEYYLPGTEPKGGQIEEAPMNSVVISFPLNQSTLTIDPHNNTSGRQTLFLRYKGTAPQGSRVFINGVDSGLAKSPFAIRDLERGQHLIEVKNPKGEEIARSQFHLR